MGAGVSSMTRLRKTLVMRAYNLRDEGQTLEDFFKEYSYCKVRNDFLRSDELHLISHHRMDSC
jgi:hypothetical protein